MPRQAPFSGFKSIFSELYGSNLQLAATDADVSEQQIRNWHSADRKFHLLADGRFILDSERIVIFKPKPGLTPNIDEFELKTTELIQKAYLGSRAAAAIAAGISIKQLNNMLAEKNKDRIAVRSVTGEFFMLGQRTILLKMSHLRRAEK